MRDKLYQFGAPWYLSCYGSTNEMKKMKTVSFFSFKGGVGRTLAMLNTAYLLARKKYFVLMVDMDIHAPGLSLMTEFMPSDSLPKIGVIDFLSDALNPDTDQIVDLKAAVFRPKLVSPQNNVDESFCGDLMFLPCGALGTDEEVREYHDKLRELPLNRLNELKSKNKSALVLEEIKEQLHDIPSVKLGGRTPDFLFIDARTGFTEISDMLINRSSDHIVMICGLNGQNRKGLDFFLAELLSDPDCLLNNLMHRLSLVLSPMPETEEASKKEVSGEIKKIIIDRARWDSSRRNKELMPKPHTIPYHPLLALSEDVISQTHPGSSSAKSYRDLADHLEKYVLGLDDQQTADGRMAATGFYEYSSGKTRKESRLQKDIGPGHPLTRLPPWNLLCPERSWHELFPSIDPKIEFDYDLFLSMAFTSQSTGSRGQMVIVEHTPDFDTKDIEGFLGVYRKGHEDLLGVPYEGWPEIAERLGARLSYWSVWLESKGLIVDVEHACGMLLESNGLDGLGPLSKYPDFWLSLGTNLHEKQQWQKAGRLILCRAISLFPENAVAMARFVKRLDDFQDFLGAEQAIILNVEWHEDKFLKANALQCLGRLRLKWSRLETAEEAFKKALELHTTVEYKTGMAHDYHGLAAIYVKDAKLLLAERELEKAWQLYSETQDRGGMAQSQQDLADVYFSLNRLELAEKKYKAALQFSEENGDSVGASYCLSGLMDLYMVMGQSGKAREFAGEIKRLEGKMANKIVVDGREQLGPSAFSSENYYYQNV